MSRRKDLAIAGLALFSSMQGGMEKELVNIQGDTNSSIEYMSEIDDTTNDVIEVEHSYSKVSWDNGIFVLNIEEVNLSSCNDSSEEGDSNTTTDISDNNNTDTGLKTNVFNPFISETDLNTTYTQDFNTTESLEERNLDNIEYQTGKLGGSVTTKFNTDGIVSTELKVNYSEDDKYVEATVGQGDRGFNVDVEAGQKVTENLEFFGGVGVNVFGPEHSDTLKFHGWDGTATTYLGSFGVAYSYTDDTEIKFEVGGEISDVTCKDFICYGADGSGDVLKFAELTVDTSLTDKWNFTLGAKFQETEELPEQVRDWTGRGYETTFTTEVKYEFNDELFVFAGVSGKMHNTGSNHNGLTYGDNLSNGDKPDTRAYFGLQFSL
jgi:hypothetical protein